MKKDVPKRVTMNIDNDLIQWVEQQVETREFDNQSAGIRKCIEIARRVYENATPEEIVKFIHGKNIEGS
jgi:Arc/MetJ-type ribon-helix-helix transcriptional regulator